jgi:N-acetyl-gamma-glutamyl-phosphate/LysW-gamma-L-alpha-aminoadipyl-6-phosphate reductase
VATHKVQVGIVGGSGYVGGELLRLLVQHPRVEIAAVTSRNHKGKAISRVHPNLRGVPLSKFSDSDKLPEVDVLFTGLPHGLVMDQIERFTSIAEKVIDLSADFRLRDPAAYATWYGQPHTQPSLLGRFVYGMPELHREEIQDACWVAVPGCTATAAILPLKPLVDTFDVKLVVVDAKVGSSAGGASVSLATHHPERSGVIRSFKPSGHRHTAEMVQELGLGEEAINFSPHAVELIRGILATCHVFIDGDFTEQDVWQAYLRAYQNEPFIRLVKERTGIYRFPEPKLLAGTNYCDIGFEKDPRTGRLVVIAAIDNLMKGAAGQAVQCFNLMCGFPEDEGLQTLALHP